MDEKAKKCAELVHEKLCIETDYGETMPQVDYIVCIDDDATSALWASKLAWKYFMKHENFPTILCVGGKGLLSRWTHKTTEGEHLADVCRQCGVGARHIVVLDEGRNTGENILAVKRHVLRNKMHIRVLFVCTKRLSLRLFLTQQKQARELIAYYYVIEETLEQACKWYNGKCLCDCELMYHELASILDRCEAYAGTFQEPIPFEVTDDVREAAEYLAEHYRLKMPRNLWQNIKALPQFVRAVREVKKHRDEMESQLETAISQTKGEIARITG
jgi:hypothetical protein